MDDLEEVLVEVHRLQMLAFIGRSARGAPCVSTRDVAHWLRLPIADCSLLVAELAEEGFVAVESARQDGCEAPLRLTLLGLGLLEWTRERTARLYTSEEIRPQRPSATA